MSRNALLKGLKWHYGLIGAVGTALICALAARGFGADAFTTTRSGPRARVLIVEDHQATDVFVPRPDRVRRMLDRGITSLTGKATPREAWLSLLSTQDVAGIKVYSQPGRNSGTRPDVAAAVVEDLLAAGLPANHIIVWDKSAADLRGAGFFDLAERFGIRVAGSAQEGYDPTNYYETPLIGNLVYGDLEFGVKAAGHGRKSFVSMLVSREMTKIINLPPMLNNNEAGVSGDLYSLAVGSVDNVIRFANDAGRLTSAVPEIYALPALSDRVVVNVVDALVCQYEGGASGLLHYSTVLNQLRFSRDPVALDVLSIKELDRQRLAAKAPFVKPNLELYNNASLLELGVSDPRKIDVEYIR